MIEQLKTFVQVAESGSFLRQPKSFYLFNRCDETNEFVGKANRSPTFIRTNHGVSLTKAGTAFIKDAEYMLQYFQESLIRMHHSAQADRHVVRVGTSMLNPCKVLIDLWNGISDRYPQFGINIVHFEDDSHTLPTTYRMIGQSLDIIAGPFLTDNLKDYYRVLELGSYRVCFAVSRQHRLASRKTLSVKDLYGERLAVVNGGNSAVIHDLRDF